MVPRCVLVERPTEYSELLARHGTREQARFFLSTHGRSLDEVEARHESFIAIRSRVLGDVPADWRAAVVDRRDLDRFLFEPEDVVLALGQDGLVANVAKYVDEQPVIGLNPEPDRFPGVLVTHEPEAAGELMRDVTRGRAAFDQRAMAHASLDDGQELFALNEVFVGHRSHQSARYLLTVGDESERQSSSGLIVSTGTGATGWTASIARERATGLGLPAPGDDALAMFVREAWPSVATGTALTERIVSPPLAVRVTSELTEGGVVFADGTEADALRVEWGQTISIGVAKRRLRLVA